MSYIGQTVGEMVDILKSVYRKSNGKQLEFHRQCINSTDLRLNLLDNFVLEIIFNILKELDKNGTK